MDTRAGQFDCSNIARIVMVPKCMLTTQEQGHPRRFCLRGACTMTLVVTAPLHRGTRSLFHVPPPFCFLTHLISRPSFLQSVPPLQLSSGGILGVAWFHTRVQGKGPDRHLGHTGSSLSRNESGVGGRPGKPAHHCRQKERRIGFR